nr:aminoacetone oxidase family FAD-binding enzyme [uncultured Mogibacterium sp.]
MSHKCRGNKGGDLSLKLPKTLRGDILIIGGGPAGMAAAISAKRSNSKIDVVLIEKNEIMGRKLRATGNGRCNITNVNAEGYSEVISFLSSIGIVTKSNENGFLYPVSESAADVSELLELRLKQLGVKVYTGVTALEVSYASDKPEFVTSVSMGDASSQGRSANALKCTVYSSALVIAAGGKSAPVYGSTGEGYRWLRGLGHTVTRLVPSLAPIECDGADLSKLSGTRVRAEAKLFKNGEEIHREDGEIQFTKFGLSGICIFNLSKMMRFEPGDTFSSFEIVLDLCREIDLGDVLKCAAERTGSIRNESFVSEKLVDVFKTVFKEGVALEIIRQAGFKADEDSLVLSSEEARDKLVASASALKFQPTGQKGWKEAQCTSGGVVESEVDQSSFESNLVKNLYIVGEVLDYDGFCGGYNLNHAFLSGKRSGAAVADRI